MTEMTIGLIGYGVVGEGVARWLTERRDDFKRIYGVDFHLKVICDRNIEEKKLPDSKIRTTDSAEEVLADDEIDVIVELIGGKTVARDIAITALGRGKNVVTANKDLIAHSGRELFDLARKNNAKIYFESAVGAGIPIIRTITEGLAGNSIKSIYGIINGTCNFILDQMTVHELSFDEALKLAQEKGYAESDPTLDINGMDTTHKISVLITQAFGVDIPVSKIYTEGIDHISFDDIEDAGKMGLCIKLLAIAKRHNGTVEAHVHPTLIPKKHPLAAIHGVLNALLIDCDRMGKVLLSGEGAGRNAAASGVISDLISLAESEKSSRLICNRPCQEKDMTLLGIESIQTKYYLRFTVEDLMGVLSQISGILSDFNIGINSVKQKQHKHKPSSTVPLIMITNSTTEESIRLSLAKIQELSVCRGRPVAIRMEYL